MTCGDYRASSIPARDQIVLHVLKFYDFSSVIGKFRYNHESVNKNKELLD